MFDDVIYFFSCLYPFPPKKVLFFYCILKFENLSCDKKKNWRGVRSKNTFHYLKRNL